MWIDLPLSAKKEMDTARHDITASIHAVNHVLVSVCSMFAEVSPLTLSHAMPCHCVVFCGVMLFGVVSFDFVWCGAVWCTVVWKAEIDFSVHCLSIKLNLIEHFPFPSPISATRTMWPQSMRSPLRLQRHRTGMAH